MATSTTVMKMELDRTAIKAMERLAKAIEHHNQIQIDIHRSKVMSPEATREALNAVENEELG